jgi:hypothetical protein
MELGENVEMAPMPAGSGFEGNFEMGVVITTALKNKVPVLDSVAVCWHCRYQLFKKKFQMHRFFLCQYSAYKVRRPPTSR